MRRNRIKNKVDNIGLLIELPTEIVVKEIPAVQIKKNILEVISIHDLPNQKKIIANIKDIGEVVLWESSSYDSIGQWSDDDVKSKLIELFLK
jgi:hypothetical protein